MGWPSTATLPENDPNPRNDTESSTSDCFPVAPSVLRVCANHPPNLHPPDFTSDTRVVCAPDLLTWNSTKVIVCDTPNTTHTHESVPPSEWKQTADIGFDRLETVAIVHKQRAIATPVLCQRHHQSCPKPSHTTSQHHGPPCSLPHYHTHSPNGFSRDSVVVCSAFWIGVTVPPLSPQR